MQYIFENVLNCKYFHAGFNFLRFAILCYTSYTKLAAIKIWQILEIKLTKKYFYSKTFSKLYLKLVVRIFKNEPWGRHLWSSDCMLD